MNAKERERKIYRVTLVGSAVNVVLLVFKFVAGILGGSAAMIADAVHSLSDFASDVVVLVLVRLGNKPRDKDHDYGHGKYETLASLIIGVALLVVGAMIAYTGIVKICRAVAGDMPQQPGVIALVAALVSIVMKEWTYRFTVKVGREVESEAVVANAWHHRSDALSSIGTAVGIGGAVALGDKWSVLDPVAAVVVSLFIVKTALSLMGSALGELLEKSLPDDVEREIIDIAGSEEGVSEVHHLQTRRIGNAIAIEMHLRMPGDTSLYEAHRRATEIEHKLKLRFGSQTHVGVHVEPVKIDGQYQPPATENK